MGKRSVRNGVLIALGSLLIAIITVFVVLRMKSVEPTYPITERWLTHPDSIIIQTDSIIAPIVYHGNPDMRQVKGDERKELFINMMLPSILLAQHKVQAEREKIESFKQRAERGTATFHDSMKIDSILSYYKCKHLEEVINNLHNHPISIVLSQAAIESGWGTSRFFLEANNVFGIWSYNKNENRIRAFETRGDNAIYLRKYNDLHGSVYDYLITISRASAYEKFREVRMTSDDPYELIQYLVNYSELREEYVKILGKVIRHNQLTQYDSFQLLNPDKNDPVWQSL